VVPQICFVRLCYKTCECFKNRNCEYFSCLWLQDVRPDGCQNYMINFSTEEIPANIIVYIRNATLVPGAAH
jgi:hypothetical protein